MTCCESTVWRRTDRRKCRWRNSANLSAMPKTGTSCRRCLVRRSALSIKHSRTSEWLVIALNHVSAKVSRFSPLFRYKTMKFSLGGSGLNSLRILAALGQRDLLFFGAIGEDQNGKIVREILKRSNVNARYA